jgi:hypothetical protein
MGSTGYWSQFRQLKQLPFPKPGIILILRRKIKSDKHWGKNLVSFDGEGTSDNFFIGFNMKSHNLIVFMSVVRNDPNCSYCIYNPRQKIFKILLIQSYLTHWLSQFHTKEIANQHLQNIAKTSLRIF